jgi:hypothetical protein
MREGEQTMETQQARNDGAVSVDDLKALMAEARSAEQRTQRKFSRMARGAANTDSKIGTITGVGLGILSGGALATGILPGAEALSDLNTMLPLVGGAFCAALGLLVGTYLDLHGVTGRE